MQSSIAMFLAIKPPITAPVVETSHFSISPILFFRRTVFPAQPVNTPEDNSTKRTMTLVFIIYPFFNLR
tara:strand:+ start:109 stop:315 length:207 start_codon:yes stop_codon:yes gene_type:complete